MGSEDLKVETRRGRSPSQDADHYVCQKIRERRLTMGLTQQQLADRVGVSYQQAYKYEIGINRITAGRLFTIAEALEVDVDYFVEGIENRQLPESAPKERVLLELARHFTSMPRTHQEAINFLARALAYPEPSLLDDVDDEASRETSAD